MYVSSDVVLSGNCGDVYVFQIAGNLYTSDNTNVKTSGGVSGSSIFWQVGGSITTGTGSSFTGIVLGDGAIEFGVNSFLTGELS